MAIFAPALARLRAELDKRWPGRDRRTDGWIGDTPHATSGAPENGGSDHNVNKRGIVDAYDIDADGINCELVVLAATRHPSVNYVIWNRRIWSRTRNFKPATYTGSNPHTDHIHISLLQTVAAENNTTPWGVASGVVVVSPAVNPTGGGGTWPSGLAGEMPVLQESPTARGSVRKCQALLNAGGQHLATDGVFGPLTTAAVRAWQQNTSLAVDGIVGPKTWSSLFGSLPTLQKATSGAPVVKLQHLLNVFGAALEPDGDFGALTHTAVREFQARFGLTVDGIVGPNTWTALLTR